MEYKKNAIVIGINLGDYGSTGSIMLNTLEYAQKKGVDVIALVPQKTRNNSPVKIIEYRFSFNFFQKIKHFLAKKINPYIILDGNIYKEFSNKIIKIIKKESLKHKKTIVHLHNIHNADIDAKALYKYLSKKKNFFVFYTLHDCWAFTGGCYHYAVDNCKEWQKACSTCPQKRKYTSKILNKRVSLLNQINNLTLIPSSNWIKKELEKSVLKKIPMIVNHGETSLTPYRGKNNLKEELILSDKKIIISVSAYWNEWKGIKYIFEVASMLPPNYVILLVGGILPKYTNKNIIHISEIKNNNELSKYYSIADVFLSTTQADTLPLVLMEAQICGLPVVGFGHGGTPEEITSKSGIMVGTDNNVSKLVKALIYTVENKPFKKKDIIESGNRFKKYECAKRQFDIYKKVCKL